MNWDYLVACYDEAKFCAKHYDPDAYWPGLKVPSYWFGCYQMGGEL